MGQYARFEERTDWNHYWDTDNSVTVSYEGIAVYNIAADALEEAGMMGQPDNVVRDYIANNWKHEVLEGMESLDELCGE